MLRNVEKYVACGREMLRLVYQPLYQLISSTYIDATYIAKDIMLCVVGRCCVWYTTPIYISWLFPHVYATSTHPSSWRHQSTSSIILIENLTIPSSCPISVSNDFIIWRSYGWSATSWHISSLYQIILPQSPKCPVDLPAVLPSAICTSSDSRGSGANQGGWLRTLSILGHGV